ncbi:Gfo/Idh/MocA family oxidoreductase [Halioglobus maricola]|uniref:Gfo/Idh/MocA family oxidoreductase n=1 Tax=Halioglobus maricola TaxID=2601894 RepID=A0A5P9NGD2_9GAMM|nr:Gfo/Idh/MocA family oxidoreductase [Halioglobus maricola]QFU74615.1 Gfo/Idh/MocA family oxidoreductase [Halioglobus maricola]
MYYNLSIQSDSNLQHFLISNTFFPENECFNLSTNLAELNADREILEKFNQFTPSAAEEDSVSVSNLDLHTSFVEFEEQDSGLIIYGLGGYAFTHVLPGLQDLKRLACVDYKYMRAREFKENHGFKYFFQTPDETENLLRQTRSPVVVIATYHSDHARLAKWVFEKNSNAIIFIEKPPCVTLDDLEMLEYIYRAGAKIEVGFNRRYAPIYRKIKKVVSGKKLFITFSIKEVLIKQNHWYNWPNQGTRLTGNLVHWIDLANYWIDAEPIDLVMNFSNTSLDDFTLSVSYDDGSLVNITCSDKGNSLRGVQELAEIRFDSQTILVDDNLGYRHIKTDGRNFNRRMQFRNKGHSIMYEEFNKNIKSEIFNYKLDDLVRTSKVTVAATEMLLKGLHHKKIV